MATYYVTESGGASPDGTTYAKAYAASDFNSNTDSFIAAGNTIYLCDEITTTLTIPASGSSGSPITLRGDYTGHSGTLQGPDATHAALYADNKDYISLVGLTFTRALTGVHAITASKYWTVTDCTFNECAQRGMLIPGSSTGPDFSDTWLIDGCTFLNNGAWGDTAAADINITVAARNFMIRDCTFRGNGVDKGVDGITWSQNGDTGRGSNNKVVNCTFYGHEENCIDLKGVDDGATYTEIINCEFGGSSQQLVNIAYETNRVRFIGCHFYDKLAGTVLTAVTAANVVAGNCTLIEFQGCKFEDTGAQCLANVRDNWSLYNCTLHNITASSSTTYPIDVYADGLTVKNCIFDTIAAGRTAGTRYTYRFAAEANYTAATLDYNAYGTTSTTGKIAIYSSTTKSLAEMQSDSKEAGGQVVDSGLSADLSPSNPSVKAAGTWIAGVRAYDDLPLPLHPDIGAVQNRDAAGRKFGVGGSAL